MRKQHLIPLLSLTLIFGTFSVTLAQDPSLNTSVEMRTRLNTDAIASTTKRVNNLEAQREKVRAEAETRRAAAAAKGDEVEARREAMKLEQEAKRAEMDAKREAKKLEAESRRASSTLRRVEFQQEIAKRKVEHTERVILATIERLEKIIVRIESRIAKVKTRGGDTSESEGFVAVAKVNLSDAKAAVNTFVTIDLSSDKAAENFERIREAAAKAREYIRVARENLMMAIRSLSSVETDVEENDNSEE